MASDPKFPAALAEWMALHQISAYRAAKILGVTQATISRWRSGQRTCRMPLAVLALMAAYEGSKARGVNGVNPPEVSGRTGGT